MPVCRRSTEKSAKAFRGLEVQCRNAIDLVLNWCTKMCTLKATNGEVIGHVVSRGERSYVIMAD